MEKEIVELCGVYSVEEEDGIHFVFFDCDTRCELKLKFKDLVFVKKILYYKK